MTGPACKRKETFWTWNRVELSSGIELKNWSAHSEIQKGNPLCMKLICPFIIWLFLTNRVKCLLFRAQMEWLNPTFSLEQITFFFFFGIKNWMLAEALGKKAKVPFPKSWLSWTCSKTAGQAGSPAGAVSGKRRPCPPPLKEIRTFAAVSMVNERALAPVVSCCLAEQKPSLKVRG